MKRLNSIVIYYTVNEGNKEMLDLIEQCMFVVCLDQSLHNLSDKSVSHQDMFRQMVTGHGCNKNGANRWFDKTIQVLFIHLYLYKSIFSKILKLYF